MALFLSTALSPRGIVAAMLALGLTAGVAACSGSTPMTPDGRGGGNVTPPANSLPVIDSITVQGTRSAKEPASFADLSETVTVTAKVHDAETAADQLEYQWSATAGSFSGTGATVTWTAPASATTPADVTITLKVVEKYGFPNQPPAFSHDVSGTATVSLHNSVKEVGDMARQFLLDFSDSTITDVPYIMRNFDPACPGTIDETSDVTQNRRILKIVKFAVGSPRVTIPFGNSFCPIPGGRIQRGDACSATASHWESVLNSNSHYTIADGDDWVSAYYHADLKAWKLCDSQFPGTCFDVTAGKNCVDVPGTLGVVPDSRRRRIELPR